MPVTETPCTAPDLASAYAALDAARSELQKAIKASAGDPDRAAALDSYTLQIDLLADVLMEEIGPPAGPDAQSIAAQSLEWANRTRAAIAGPAKPAFGGEETDEQD